MNQSTEIIVDMHMHSTHSDGSLSPRELVDLAQAQGISLISLTDHDGLSGLPEAQARAAAVGIGFLPGVELSAHFKGGTCHILGYGIDPQHAGLNEALSRLRLARFTRNDHILARLNDLGYPLEKADFLAQAQGSKSPGRPHMAAALAAKGLVGNLQAAFTDLLAPGKPAYIPKEIFQPEEAISLIREAGGSSFVAHPVTLNLPPANMGTWLARMQQAGLDGIEVYNSLHSPPEAQFLRDLAQDLGLQISGGSDFHGLFKPQVELGFWKPGQPIWGQDLHMDLINLQELRG